MKAKDYYEKYLADLTEENSKDRIWKLITAMMKEITEIQTMRHAHSNSAIVAIFREQNQKWNALLKYNAVNPNLGLKRNGFIEVVKYRFSQDVPKEVFDQIVKLFEGAI